jgi:hypothetical protein
VLRRPITARIATLCHPALWLVAASLGIAAVDCASQPPPRPTALDPSNPQAPESPPLSAPLLNDGGAPGASRPGGSD